MHFTQLRGAGSSDDSGAKKVTKSHKLATRRFRRELTLRTYSRTYSNVTFTSTL